MAPPGTGVVVEPELDVGEPAPDDSSIQATATRLKHAPVGLKLSA